MTDQMIDFDMDYDTVTAAPAVVVRQQVPLVTESVSVRPTTSQSTTYVMRDGAVWTWSDLRDYVVREIEARHGPSVRNPMKEAGVFKGFLARWPEDAAAIAQFAFGPVCNGMWRSAPISVNRFCKASDEFFAAPIAARL
jgi:hypothetical protein